MRKYDINFILSPLVAEDCLNEEVLKIRNIIETAGGAVFDSEMPKMRPLMYGVSKTVAGKKSSYEQGHFGWLKIEAEPEKIPGINAQAFALDQVIRLMVSDAYLDTRSKRIGYTPEGAPVAEGLKAEPAIRLSADETKRFDHEEKKKKLEEESIVKEKTLAAPATQSSKTISDEELDKQIDSLLS